MTYQEITVTDQGRIQYQGIYFLSPALEGPDKYQFAEWKQIFAKSPVDTHWYQTTEEPLYSILDREGNPGSPLALRENFQAIYEAKPDTKNVKTSTRPITEKELNLIAFSTKQIPEED